MTDAGKVMITPKGEYDASVTYEKYDNVSYSGVLYIALKTVTGIEPTDDGTNWMKWIDLGSVDVNSLSPTFTEATDRVNVMSGETIPTLFGKIKKWFTDLKEIAFSGSYNDLSDTPTIPAAVSVKGNNETAYRTGEVNLTAEDIGAVATDGDTAENTVAFTSADSTTATAWTDVSALATGEKHSSILNKVSTMFKNIRFLYKMLGTTDISAIGDGTVTNALSTLNSNLKNYFPNVLDVQNLPYLDNCLNISIDDINFSRHNPMKVNSSSINIPSGLSDGVRLYFPIVGSKFVVIIIIGFKTDRTSAIWKNSYNYNVGDWNGWVEL